MTLDSVTAKIERGDYRPDAEAFLLARLALREGGTTQNDNANIMADFYNSMERGRKRFANDALQAVGLASHPCAEDIFYFAETMAGDEADETKQFAILRRIAGFIHASGGSRSTETEH